MATTQSEPVYGYTKRARSVAEYTRMRGVTDFSNAQAFNVFESGFSFLFIISRPPFLTHNKTPEYGKYLLDIFCHILEYEFKGLSGIEDVTSDDIEITDGVSTMTMMGKTTKQSASEITMSFTEKSGSAITKFIKYYIEGVRNPRTQAKTYHGLIEQGEMAPGFENEVFNLLYVVTDNTLLQVESSYLLCNAYPNKAPTGDLYNSTKGEIDKKDIDVTMKCFVIDGPEVDQRAVKLLSSVSGNTDFVGNVYTAQAGSEDQTSQVVTSTAKSDVNVVSESDKVTRDESQYQYSAFTDNKFNKAGAWSDKQTEN